MPKTGTIFVECNYMKYLIIMTFALVGCRAAKVTDKTRYDIDAHHEASRVIAGLSTLDILQTRNYTAIVEDMDSAGRVIRRKTVYSVTNTDARARDTVTISSATDVHVIDRTQMDTKEIGNSSRVGVIIVAAFGITYLLAVILLIIRKWKT